MSDVLAALVQRAPGLCVLIDPERTKREARREHDLGP